MNMKMKAPTPLPMIPSMPRSMLLLPILCLSMSTTTTTAALTGAFTNTNTNRHSTTTTFSRQSPHVSISHSSRHNRCTRTHPCHRRRNHKRQGGVCLHTTTKNNNNNESNDDERKEDAFPSRRSNTEQEESSDLESLEKILVELGMNDDDDDNDDDDEIRGGGGGEGEDEFMDLLDGEDLEQALNEEELLALFRSLPDGVDDGPLSMLDDFLFDNSDEYIMDNDDDNDDDNDNDDDDEIIRTSRTNAEQGRHTAAESGTEMEKGSSPTTKESSAAAAATKTAAVSFLEDALLQGVVPADAGVGENSLPGDFGFDPLHLATEDYIRPAQSLFWKLVPGASAEEIQKWNEPRQSALILRDYREAEIRHSRLAMLAATIWPLQEMLDRLLLDQDQFGSTTFVYGGVTLPYLTLVMVAVMMLLGYLDIYASSIKDVDDVGEAFLPGDCFWDPLSILEGAPATMKRNMQERELFNGRFAMIAVAFYIFEEATTHKPLITIPGNELLFEPAYLIPYIQQFLDSIFATSSPLFVFPDSGSVEEEEAIRTILQKGDAMYSQIP